MSSFDELQKPKPAVPSLLAWMDLVQKTSSPPPFSDVISSHRAAKPPLPPSPAIEDMLAALAANPLPKPPPPSDAFISSLFSTPSPAPPPQPASPFVRKLFPTQSMLLSGYATAPIGSTILARSPPPPLAKPVIPKHRVFVSFHHANDELAKRHFVEHFGSVMDGFESQAVSDGDIDPYLTTDTIRSKIRDEFIRESTVTVVLIGTQTWQRRHVDWEISSSIRNTQLHNRCGLIGILLPTHPSSGQKTYDKGIVPPRLFDNQACGYAKIYHWTEDANDVRAWIHEAFERRTLKEPVNSYPNFVNDKTAARWDL